MNETNYSEDILWNNENKASGLVFLLTDAYSLLIGRSHKNRALPTTKHFFYIKK